MIQLKVLKGAQQGTIFKLRESTFNIGRALSNEVILYDDKVSGRHAIISQSSGRTIVRDVGSRNGTFLNGSPVEAAVIKSGDKLRLGETVLLFKATEEPLTTDAGTVRVVKNAKSTIHETVRSSEGSGIFNVSEVSIDALMAAHRNLKALYQVNNVLNSTFELSRLFERILDQIFNVTRANRAALMVVDEKTKNLEPKALRMRDGRAPMQLTLSHTIVNEVLHRGSGILTQDAMSDDRFSSGESVTAFHIRSAMCVPIRSKEQTIGIIYVDNEESSGTFKRSDLELLTALGNEAGVAIENAKLFEANVRAERLAALGEALAGLSHYIKNILMCMQGGGQLVQRAIDDANYASVEKGWNIVRRNERKLSSLVMDMLSYCKDRLPLREECNLREIICDVLDLSEPLLDEKAIDIRHNLDGRDIILSVDQEAISRCLLNIFSNAFDAVGPSGGEIEINGDTDAVTDEVVLRIRDNGCGIPPEILPNIFDAFCSTKGAKGTGLGLAVVQKVVKEHGGNVTALSEPGRGTEFIIRLPQHPEADQQ